MKKMLVPAWIVWVWAVVTALVVATAVWNSTMAHPHLHVPGLGLPELIVLGVALTLAVRFIRQERER